MQSQAKKSKSDLVGGLVDIVGQEFAWTDLPADTGERLRSMAEGIEKVRKNHDPEYLSTLELKELLETIPEGTLVSVDLV